MRGISDALIKRLRRADPTARIMVEGRIETAAEIKQRYDQWQQLDSLPAAAELLQDGGVRLKATATNGPLSTTVTSGSTYYRTLGDGGYTGDIIGPAFPALGSTQHLACCLVDWKGTESPELELTQVQAWLHPQFSLSIDKNVANWGLDLYAVTFAPDLFKQWTVRPILSQRLKVPATGQAAGFVVFDLPEAERPRPKEVTTTVLFGTAADHHFMLAVFHALKADGTAASNVGLGYDSGASSVTSATGSTMQGWLFTTGTNPANLFFNAGASNTVPATKFIVGAYTAATVAFSDGTPDVNLGVSTPKAQIELVGRGQTPSGTSLAYQVRDDSSVWQTFTDGQTLDTVSGTFASGSYSTLKMRSTLTPNAAGDATPILRGLGARAVSVTNLSDVAEVESVSWAFDPLDHHAEIPELRLSAIHDGERDFRDAISLFLSQQSIGAMSLRLYCGDASLGKSDWVHLDDFLIDDYDLAADRAYITGVSPLALVRGALPKLIDQGTAYPDSTVSNPGAWTEVGGATNLYAALADNEGGIGLVPWDDTTAIQSVVNPSSAQYTAGLQDISQPSTPIVGQVIVQFRYKLVSGSSLTLACALMQGATQKSSISVTATSTNVVQGTLTPTVTELASISDWTDLRLRFTANGTGQIQVTWARLVVLPVRLPLTYSLASPAAIVQDLLSGQIGLDGRYRGPDLQGVAGIGTGTTITLGKTIASPIGGSTDLTIAKQELDAVSYLAGAVHTSSQGRVVARQLYDVTVGTDGTVTYAPKTRAPSVFIPREELTPTSVRPGFQYRVPEFDVDWGFIESSGSYLGMAHGVSDVALQNLGEARIVSQKHAPETVSRWVQDQGLANGVAFRQVQAFGMGYMGWRFLSEYAYPELELGDVIAIETDRFLAYDPSAVRAIAGANWVACIVVGIFDPWGHDLAVWVPSFASIGAASAIPPPRPPGPTAIGTDLAVDGGFESGLQFWTALSPSISIERGANIIKGSATLKIDHTIAASRLVVNSTAPGMVQPGFSQTLEGKFGALIIGDNFSVTLEGTGYWVSPNGTTVASIGLYCFDSNGAAISGTATAGPTWQSETVATYKRVNIVLPVGTNYALLAVETGAAGTGGQFYLDDVRAVVSGVATSANTVQGRPGLATSYGSAPLVLNKQISKTTSSTTEVSLATYSLPANSLAVDGQGIRIHLSGQFKHATGGEVRVKFGATYVLSYLNGAARNWDSTIKIVRTGGATQISTAGTFDDTPASAYERNAPGETLSGAVTIDFRGWTNNATQPMTIDMLTVEHVSD